MKVSWKAMTAAIASSICPCCVVTLLVSLFGITGAVSARFSRLATMLLLPFVAFPFTVYSNVKLFHNFKELLEHMKKVPHHHGHTDCHLDRKTSIRSFAISLTMTLAADAIFLHAFFHDYLEIALEQ